VLRERLRRAKQARLCPMSCLPQASRGSHKHGSLRFGGEERKHPRLQEAKCVARKAGPVSHRLVDAGKWFTNLGGCGSGQRWPIMAREGRSKRRASLLPCRSLWTFDKCSPRCCRFSILVVLSSHSVDDVVMLWRQEWTHRTTVRFMMPLGAPRIVGKDYSSCRATLADQDKQVNHSSIDMTF